MIHTHPFKVITIPDIVVLEMFYVKGSCGKFPVTMKDIFKIICKGIISEVF